MENNFIQDLEKLEHLSVSCLANWKQGNDPRCFEYFIRTLEQLEQFVDFHYGSFSEKKEELLHILKQLDHYVWNKDMISISDVLEHEFMPFIREWRQAIIHVKAAQEEG